MPKKKRRKKVPPRQYAQVTVDRLAMIENMPEMERLMKELMDLHEN